MAGTRTGGLRAAATIKKTRPTHYEEIGALGGSKSKTGGFSGPEGRKRAIESGRKGGKASRKPKKIVE